MALGSKGFNNNGPLIFLTPRVRDAEGNKAAPHFTVDRKGDDGKYIRDEETITSVSGDLFRAELKAREYEGEKSNEAVLYLRDNDVDDGQGGKISESYRVAIRFGVAGRGLINSLYSLVADGDFSNLTLDYYENKNGYDTYGLKQNGEQVRWAIDLADQPKPEPVMHKGKLVKNDYSLLNEFWETKFAEIVAKVGGNKASAAKTPAAASTPSTKSTTALDAPADKPVVTAKTVASAAKKTTATRATKAAATTTATADTGASQGTSDVPASADPF